MKKTKYKQTKKTQRTVGATSSRPKPQRDDPNQKGITMVGATTSRPIPQRNDPNHNQKGITMVGATSSRPIPQRNDPNCNQKGITIVALVITIIVLLILAGITIWALRGDNGIIKNTISASEEYKIEKGMEQIQLVLGDDVIERTMENEILTLTRLVRIFEPKPWVVSVEKIEEESKITIINDEGYIYDIIINEEGKVEVVYIGKTTGPIITKITVVKKDTRSIEIEVSARNEEGAKYTYWYKKEIDEEYIKAGESNKNTYKYDGLEDKETYNIKVEMESNKGKSEKVIKEETGELPEGTIEFTKGEWEEQKTSVRINTTEEGYELQYQKNGTGEGNWTEIINGGEVEGLTHNDTIYARLWDGVNGTNYASVEIEDDKGPVVTLETTEIGMNYVIVNVITAEDGEMGMPETPTYTFHIKKTGEADEKYEQIQTGESVSCTKQSLETHVSYTIKVETQDKVGNIGVDTEVVIPGLSETPSSYFTWTTSTTAATITGLSAEGKTAYDNGELTALVMPKTYNNLPVTTIGGNAFSGRSLIKTVIIPESVTKIGISAFNGCTGIAYLSIPISTNASNVSGHTYTGDYINYNKTKASFYGCTGLTTLILTKGTGTGCGYSTTTGTYDVNNHQGTPWYQSRANEINVTIEEGVTSIGAYMFSGCTGIKTVSIPTSLTTINGYAFNGCTGMTSIKTASGTNKVTFPSLTAIGGAAFNNCSSLLGELKIPETMTSISNSSFAGCKSITKLIIPDSVTKIGISAFLNCTGISYLSMPISTNASNVSGHTYEGDYINYNRTKASFYGCTGLTTLVLTKGTGAGFTYSTTTGNKDVNNHQGTPWYQSRANDITVTIEEGITTIGTYMFNGCTGIKTVTIPESLTTINGYAFNGCTGMTSIKTPGGANSITFPNLTTIGGVAFNNCSSLLGELKIPQTMTSISGSSFAGCKSITRLIIPDSVTKIGINAFLNCTGINYLSIPISTNASNVSGHTYTGDYINYNKEKAAFYGCTGLTTLILTKGTGTGYGYSTTTGNTATNNYQGTPWFQSRAQEKTIIIEKGVNSIGAYMFYGCGTMNFKYTGTEEEWNAITKGTNSNVSTTVEYNATI